jgi:hypothetical protein
MIKIDKNIIMLLLSVLFIFYLLHCNDINNKNKMENFTSKYAANDHIYLGHRRDGNDLLDDSLFNHVVTYENDDDPYDSGSKLGIEKCLENCAGKCVEFGVTGIGHCFPLSDDDAK